VFKLPLCFTLAMALCPFPTQAGSFIAPRITPHGVVLLSASTLEATPDLFQTPPYLAGSLRYSPYEQWLLPRLPAGAVLYNRPCSFSDGVTSSTVPCPGTLVVPVVYATVPQRVVTTVAPRGYARVGTGRHFRLRSQSTVRWSRALARNVHQEIRGVRRSTALFVLPSAMPDIAACPVIGTVRVVCVRAGAR
jgi:hypothetical protein